MTTKRSELEEALKSLKDTPLIPKRDLEGDTPPLDVWNMRMLVTFLAEFALDLDERLTVKRARAEKFYNEMMATGAFSTRHLVETLAEFCFGEADAPPEAQPKAECHFCGVGGNHEIVDVCETCLENAPRYLVRRLRDLYFYYKDSIFKANDRKDDEQYVGEVGSPEVERCYEPDGGQFDGWLPDGRYYIYGNDDTEVQLLEYRNGKCYFLERITAEEARVRGRTERLGKRILPEQPGADTVVADPPVKLCPHCMSDLPAYEACPDKPSPADAAPDGDTLELKEGDEVLIRWNGLNRYRVVHNVIHSVHPPCWSLQQVYKKRDDTQEDRP